MILSKGHTAAVLYAVLAESSYFLVAELEQYGQDGSRLLTHVSHGVPGVDFMEHQLKYHYSAPRSAEDLREVLRQLKGAG